MCVLIAHTTLNSICNYLELRVLHWLFYVGTKADLNVEVAQATELEDSFDNAVKSHLAAHLFAVL
jgi:hypothetical protein